MLKKISDLWPSRNALASHAGDEVPQMISAADDDGVIPPISEKVISYARFLEIRQRRARVMAELLPAPPVVSPSPDARQAVVIDVVPDGDTRGGS